VKYGQQLDAKTFFFHLIVVLQRVLDAELTFRVLTGQSCFGPCEVLKLA